MPILSIFKSSFFDILSFFHERLKGSASFVRKCQLFMQIYEITKNTDALEKANSATLSQANYLYDTNKYVEALKLYESLSGYDHVDVTLKKLDALKKILSTSIHIGGSSSVWENTTMQCITCHSPTLVYQFILKANGRFTFYRYCTMHNTEDDY